MREPGRRNWVGELNSTTAILPSATPPALVEYLWVVDEIINAVATMPYPGAALMYEGNTTNLTTRRFGIIVPPACTWGRAYITRTGIKGTGAAQADSEFDTETSGSLDTDTTFTADGDTITVPAQTTGAEQYMDVGTDPGDIRTFRSGDGDGVITKNRRFELPEALEPALEDVETNMACGWSLQIVIQSQDLESL